MLHLDNLRTDEALLEWRAAVKSDPSFALGWVFVAYGSLDPREETAALARAKKMARHASPSEQLLIRWLTGVRENDYVPAIAALNDLLAKYPRDQRLAFIGGRWFVQQAQYQQAQRILERALSEHADYPALLNEAAYAYAYTGDFRRAAELIERYVALSPNEPNPQDTYGELLRHSGDYKGALEHYRAALKIDPGWYSSQLGLADTYALMGDQQQARAEYQKAIALVQSASDKVQFAMQAALTFVRENKLAEADKALEEAVRQARRFGLPRLETQGYRMMAMCSPAPDGGLKHLVQADLVLVRNRQMTRSDRDEEHARILRQKVVLETRAGRAEAARKSVGELEIMATVSRSHVIQRSYHAALGALLMADGKEAEAIPHLQEDSGDALSMQALVLALEHKGETAEAQQVRGALLHLNEPTLEQALVVPAMRAASGATAAR